MNRNQSKLIKIHYQQLGSLGEAIVTRLQPTTQNQSFNSYARISSFSAAQACAKIEHRGGATSYAMQNLWTSGDSWSLPSPLTAVLTVPTCFMRLAVTSALFF